MGPSLSLLLILAVLAAALAWLLGGRRRRASGEASDEIDRETLEEAESELEDLDAFATPDDADDELPDWGPGAPKP